MNIFKIDNSVLILTGIRAKYIHTLRLLEYQLLN